MNIQPIKCFKCGILCSSRFLLKMHLHRQKHYVQAKKSFKPNTKIDDVPVSNKAKSGGNTSPAPKATVSTTKEDKTKNGTKEVAAKSTTQGSPPIQKTASDLSSPSALSTSSGNGGGKSQPSEARSDRTKSPDRRECRTPSSSKRSRSPPGSRGSSRSSSSRSRHFDSRNRRERSRTPRSKSSRRMKESSRRRPPSPAKVEKPETTKGKLYLKVSETKLVATVKKVQATELPVSAKVAVTEAQGTSKVEPTENKIESEQKATGEERIITPTMQVVSTNVETTSVSDPTEAKAKTDQIATEQNCLVVLVLPEVPIDIEATSEVKKSIVDDAESGQKAPEQELSVIPIAPTTNIEMSELPSVQAVPCIPESKKEAGPTPTAADKLAIIDVTSLDSEQDENQQAKPDSVIVEPISPTKSNLYLHEELSLPAPVQSSSTKSEEDKTVSDASTSVSLHESLPLPAPVQPSGKFSKLKELIKSARKTTSPSLTATSPTMCSNNNADTFVSFDQMASLPSDAVIPLILPTVSAFKSMQMAQCSSWKPKPTDAVEKTTKFRPKATPGPSGNVELDNFKPADDTVSNYMPVSRPEPTSDPANIETPVLESHPKTTSKPFVDMEMSHSMPEGDTSLLKTRPETAPKASINVEVSVSESRPEATPKSSTVIEMNHSKPAEDTFTLKIRPESAPRTSASAEDGEPKQIKDLTLHESRLETVPTPLVNPEPDNFKRPEGMVAPCKQGVLKNQKSTESNAEITVIPAPARKPPEVVEILDDESVILSPKQLPLPPIPSYDSPKPEQPTKSADKPNVELIDLAETVKPADEIESVIMSPKRLPPIPSYDTLNLKAANTEIPRPDDLLDLSGIVRPVNETDEVTSIKINVAAVTMKVGGWLQGSNVSTKRKRRGSGNAEAIGDKNPANSESVVSSNAKADALSNSNTDVRNTAKARSTDEPSHPSVSAHMVPPSFQGFIIPDPQKALLDERSLTEALGLVAETLTPVLPNEQADAQVATNLSHVADQGKQLPGEHHEQQGLQKSQLRVSEEEASHTEKDKSGESLTCSAAANYGKEESRLLSATDRAYEQKATTVRTAPENVDTRGTQRSPRETTFAALNSVAENEPIETTKSNLKSLLSKHPLLLDRYKVRIENATTMDSIRTLCDDVKEAISFLKARGETTTELPDSSSETSMNKGGPVHKGPFTPRGPSPCSSEMSLSFSLATMSPRQTVEALLAASDSRSASPFPINTTASFLKNLPAVESPPEMDRVAINLRQSLARLKHSSADSVSPQPIGIENDNVFQPIGVEKDKVFNTGDSTVTSSSLVDMPYFPRNDLMDLDSECEFSPDETPGKSIDEILAEKYENAYQRTAQPKSQAAEAVESKEVSEKTKLVKERRYGEAGLKIKKKAKDDTTASAIKPAQNLLNTTGPVQIYPPPPKQRVAHTVKAPSTAAEPKTYQPASTKRIEELKTTVGLNRQRSPSGPTDPRKTASYLRGETEVPRERVGDVKKSASSSPREGPEIPRTQATDAKKTTPFSPRAEVEVPAASKHPKSSPRHDTESGAKPKPPAYEKIRERFVSGEKRQGSSSPHSSPLTDKTSPRNSPRSVDEKMKSSKRKDATSSLEMADKVTLKRTVSTSSAESDGEKKRQDFSRVELPIDKKKTSSSRSQSKLSEDIEHSISGPSSNAEKADKLPKKDSKTEDTKLAEEKVGSSSKNAADTSKLPSKCIEQNVSASSSTAEKAEISLRKEGKTKGGKLAEEKESNNSTKSAAETNKLSSECMEKSESVPSASVEKPKKPTKKDQTKESKPADEKRDRDSTKKNVERNKSQTIVKNVEKVEKPSKRDRKGHDAKSTEKKDDDNSKKKADEITKKADETTKKTKKRKDEEVKDKSSDIRKKKKRELKELDEMTVKVPAPEISPEDLLAKLHESPATAKKKIANPQRPLSLDEIAIEKTIIEASGAYRNPRDGDVVDVPQGKKVLVKYSNYSSASTKESLLGENLAVLDFVRPESKEQGAAEVETEDALDKKAVISGSPCRKSKPKPLSKYKSASLIKLKKATPRPLSKYNCLDDEDFDVKYDGRIFMDFGSDNCANCGAIFTTFLHASPDLETVYFLCKSCNKVIVIRKPEIWPPVGTVFCPKRKCLCLYRMGLRHEFQHLFLNV